jgi:hypothetical protein
MGEATDGKNAGFNRREMLKRSAIAAGAGAAVWAAPHIETLGAAPAFADGIPASQLVILSPASDDKEQNNGQNECPVPGACCGSSFGDAGKVDTFTFTNPWPNCSQVVVRTITLNCDTNSKNPDVGQFAVVIASHTGPNCQCRVLDGVLIASSGRAILQKLNNGSACSGGIDASVACNNPLLVSSSRLAVELTCSNAFTPLT